MNPGWLEHSPWSLVARPPVRDDRCAATTGSEPEKCS
jgi:hypothetical protein